MSPKDSPGNGTNRTWKSKDRTHESIKGRKTANANDKHDRSSLGQRFQQRYKPALEYGNTFLAGGWMLLPGSR